MNDHEPQKEIIVSDPVNFEVVALKNFAEIYYLIQFLSRKEYDVLVNEAVETGMPDGKCDKYAVASFWNERVGSPIFQIRDIPPEPPRIIIP